MLGMFKEKKPINGIKGSKIIKEMPRGIRINFIDEILETKGFSGLRKIKKKIYPHKCHIIGTEIVYHKSEMGEDYWHNIYLDLNEKNRF